MALMNNQPMGFYPMETLKQDARRFGVPFLNPCVNVSRVVCTPEDGSVRLGLELIKDVGVESAKLVVKERERHGPYATAGDLVRRTGLKPQAVLSLAMAGAFDGIAPNRREALWEAGLHTRPSRNGQAALPASVQDGVPPAAGFHGAGEDDGRVPGDQRISQGAPDGVRQAPVSVPMCSPRWTSTGAGTTNWSRWPDGPWRGSTRAGGTARSS